ncbi:hypothetical protein GOP47_0001947 [Adiantum capillus-veneris]|uniref:C2 domain-containing protein n=1 Tax=Adiantum capillus-veneris TaxID=13818 RepID=A0A9D4V9X7_ADICA|nr:hypothetical protein GOP47_0001947 [Adiantum capillus-veneris]
MEVGEFVSKWMAAQSVSFGVALISGAQQLLHFLAQVDRQPCLYEALQSLEQSNGMRNAGFHCFPNLAGMTPHCPYNHLLTVLGSGMSIGSIRSDDAIETTKAFWEERFPHESYTLDLDQFHYDDQWTPPTEVLKRRRIKYDLEKAVTRQRTFLYQVSKPHMMVESFLSAAEQRYKAFLHLFKMTDCKVFLVPTYDIDLLWHTHQLNPKVYLVDLTRILGRVLEHDDTDTDRSSDQKLDEGFCQTAERWLQSYGSVYEKAGAMYRGEPPAPVYSSFQVPATGIPPNFTPIAPREIMQVYLTILRADGLPKKQGGIQVCLQLQKKCSAFKLKTPLIPSMSEPVWMHTWKFQAEKSTEGFLLELLRRHSRSVVQMFKGSDVLGYTSLSWESLLSTPTLSYSGWLSLTSPVSSVTKGPSLYVSVSLTPPQPAPQLFRLINSIPTDDKGYMGMGSLFHRSGCWLTRIVLDHANRQLFIIRARYSDGFTRTPEAQKCIYIHQGGWEYQSSRSIRGTAPATVVASLIVRASTVDTKWNLRPHLELNVNLNYQIGLVCGRKLDYEVKGASEDEEGGFVTLIRYNLVNSSMGKATALFNWRTGAMEVSPEESVVLVLLLSSIISKSVMDMKGVKVTFNQRRKPPSRSIGTTDEWGSVVLETKDESDRSMSLFYCWWAVHPIVWSSTFYTPSNTVFGASGCGAAGSCGAGACGGSACGGARCGGAAGGGCGGGCGG